MPLRQHKGLFLAGTYGGWVTLGGLSSSVVIALGADQYDDMDEDEARQKKSFFAYYYMVVQVGGLLVAVPPELLNASVMWGAAIIVVLFLLAQAGAMAFYTKDYRKVCSITVCCTSCVMCVCV